MGKVDLNILQWNSQSIKPKIVEFEQILCQEKIHFAAVSETWLAPEISINLKEYNIFRLDRDDNYGGVAILSHKSFITQMIPLQCVNSAIEVVAVKISNCELIEYIVSVYCSPSVSTSDIDWDCIFSISNNRTIIVGDFNGHHSNWSNRTNSRGIQIFDTLVDHNFVTLNDGSITRLKLVNNVLQQSTPDITIVSSDIALKFNWKVTNECLGSDHLMIKFTTSVDYTPIINKKRNFKKADWGRYRQIMEEECSRWNLPDDPQEAYDSYIEIINKAAEDSIPYVRVCVNPCAKFVPKPYWTPMLSKVVAERRLALSMFRRNPTPDNLEKLKKKTCESQKLIRNARNKGWWELCSSLNEVSSATEMWRRMRWLKGYKPANRTVEKSLAETLLCNLTPDFVSQPQPCFTSENSKLETNISAIELQKCFKSKDTAPGLDDISYSMLFNMPDSGKTILLNIYNLFISLNFVPYQWRHIRILPIPKPGRDCNSVSSLRPISLMSCICKIFHAIINNRIEWYLENSTLFSEKIVGFRKGRSCLDNLTNLITSIQIGLTENLITVGCFIDIENAYNNVDIFYLLSKLDRLGVGAKLCRYLWSFLRQRCLTIEGPNYKISRSTAQGLAQGDPISPLLFNVATIDICKTITSLTNIHISQYADDFVIYLTSKNLVDAQNIIQGALNVLYDMFLQMNLNISPSKTKACIFTRGFRRNHVNLKIEDVAVEIVENVKYLGMWLDRSVKWRKHINEIVVKVSKFLNIFKVLSGSGWGVHPKHLRKLYISIIRSRLDYASFLYDNCCKTNLYKLDKIQNQAMRTIGGFIKSTPIHVMESELSLCPLHLRRQYLAGKFWLKNKAIVDNCSIKLITNLGNLCSNRYWGNKKKPLLTLINENYSNLSVYSTSLLGMFSLDQWVTSINISNSLRTEVEGITNSKRHYHAHTLKSRCITYLNENYRFSHMIFTDGSKDSHGIGAAFHCFDTNASLKFKIDVNISIMEAELVAIHEALSYIDSMKYNNSVILSDSKSSLQHLARCTSIFRGLPVAYAIIKLLLKLQAESRIVYLQWIPSHIGLDGNEQADFLAKQAISEGINIKIIPSFQNYIPILKLDCYNLWKEYFDKRSREKGIWYRTIQPHPLNIPWIDNIVLNRHELVIALRLRSGHTPCNKFSYLMRKSVTANCLTCNVIDDVYHILMECVQNLAERNNTNLNKMLIGDCNSTLADPLSDKAKRLYKLVAR